MTVVFFVVWCWAFVLHLRAFVLRTYGFLLGGLVWRLSVGFAYIFF
jgi:hypothetical protein